MLKPTRREWLLFFVAACLLASTLILEQGRYEDAKANAAYNGLRDAAPKRAEERIATYNGWLVRVTLVLGVATIALFIVTRMPGIRDGSSGEQLFIAGRCDYRDVFGVKHWTKCCYAICWRGGRFSHPEVTAFYNNTDDEEQGV